MSESKTVVDPNGEVKYNLVELRPAYKQGGSYRSAPRSRVVHTAKIKGFKERVDVLGLDEPLEPGLYYMFHDRRGTRPNVSTKDGSEWNNPWVEKWKCFPAETGIPDAYKEQGYPEWKEGDLPGATTSSADPNNLPEDGKTPESTTDKTDDDVDF